MDASNHEWIIVLIKEPQLEYHAIRSKGLKPNSNLQLRDGRTIKRKNFDVLVNDLTALEAVMFMALPTQIKDQILAGLESENSK